MKVLILRYRARFSVGALLAFVSIICILLGTASRRLERQRQAQALALLVIERLHGVAQLSEQLPADAGRGTSLPSLADLMARARRFIGDKFESLDNVDVSFNPYVLDAALEMRADDDDLRVICAAGSVRRLTLDGTGVTDSGLASLASLPHLETLELRNRITPAQLTASMLMRRLGGPADHSTGIWVMERDYGARGKPAESMAFVPCWMPSLASLEGQTFPLTRCGGSPGRLSRIEACATSVGSNRCASCG